MKKKKGIMKLAFMLVASGGLLIFTSPAQAIDTGQQTQVSNLLRKCCDGECSGDEIANLKRELSLFHENHSGDGTDSKSGD